MSKYKQTSFIGGLNRQFDPTKIGDNEYPLLINGRVRDDRITTVNLPEEITLGLPTNDGVNYQGVYSVGTFLVVFADGQAYYRDFGANAVGDFKRINDLQLSATVERIYLTLVPGSSVNFRRVLDGANANDSVNLTEVVTGSPDCALATDGINQDWVIFPDATSRITKTWEDWENSLNGENREYVPKGTYPCYSNGILYKAGIDPATGRLNRLLRSVTGRPLDFMVVVDNNGNKKPNKQDGDANIVAHRVNFNNISSINEIAVIENPQNSQSVAPPILVGATYNSYLVTPLLDNTLFGEPKFAQRFLFSTCPLNPFCVIDAIGGDTLLIDAKGVISFNAALFAKYEGRNLPFSRKVYPLFNGITQTTACCAKLDNYIYFGVNTIYGPAVVVYDEITQQWVSIDIYPSVNLIKQFAVISTVNTKRLFFITTDNKLYEAFASDSVATCRGYFGDWSEDFNQSVLNFSALFRDTLSSGRAAATLYADGKKINTVTLPLEVNKVESTTPQPLPFGDSLTDTGDDKTFGFENAPKAHKVGVLLEWNANATLEAVGLESADHKPITNPSQDSLISGMSSSTENPLKICFLGWAGLDGDILDNLVTFTKQQEPSYIILLGNNNQPAGALASLQANVKDHWDILKQEGKVLGVLGEDEYDTLNAQAHLQYFPGGRYYTTNLDTNTALFVVNSNSQEPNGITSDSNQAKWLKQALANSTKKWKIVVMFGNPLYTEDLDWPFRRWGASLVICAQNRNYEKLFQNQFLYINNGSGTCNGFDEYPSPTLSSSQNRNNTDNGIVVVETDILHLEGKFLRSTDGATLDVFQLLG